MTKTAHFNGQPVEIIGRENRHEVWIETADGRILRVFKRGLTTAPQNSRRIELRIDSSRGTDGAR